MSGSLDKSIFEPSLLLPSQYEGGAVGLRKAGEARLLWAILYDGVETYCREVGSAGPHSAEFEEAEHWIFGATRFDLTAFETLCDIFGLDVESVRDRLRAFATGARRSPSLPRRAA